MGAGEQQIRVTFNGSETYRPSEAEEGSLTVKKANVSVKVHSTSIYADEVPGEGFVQRVRAAARALHRQRVHRGC